MTEAIAQRRPSKAQLRALGNGEDEEPLPDGRSSRMMALAVVQDSVNADGADAMAAVFAGTDVMADPLKAGLIRELRAEAYREWDKSKKAFLAIGRALLRAEDELSPYEFARLRQGCERILPFSDSMASQLRQVARAVDDGRINEVACPGSCSVAYQIAVMDDHTIGLARARNLIRPDVTRLEVIAFRKQVATAPSRDGSPPDLAAVARERGRLQKDRNRKARAVAALDARIAQLDAMLEPQGRKRAR